MVAVPASGCEKPPYCASQLPQTKGVGQDPASLALAGSGFSNPAIATRSSCPWGCFPWVPCGPRAMGWSGGCLLCPPAARQVTPPQLASLGMPSILVGTSLGRCPRAACGSSGASLAGPAHLVLLPGTADPWGCCEALLDPTHPS